MRPRSCKGLKLFQSTPPARGATLDFLGTVLDFIISIHAPREGGDAIACMTVLVISIFQSTPPARGATPAAKTGTTQRERFQSTPPARGATFPFGVECHHTEFQSTPPARGATCLSFSACSGLSLISIHAPREGGDVKIGQDRSIISIISIHAPREGGDCTHLAERSVIWNFNPRPPRGGRPAPRGPNWIS